MSRRILIFFPVLWIRCSLSHPEKLPNSRVRATGTLDGWDVSVPSTLSLRKVEGAIAVLMSRTRVVFGTNKTIRVVWGRSAGSIPSPTEVL